MPNYVLTYRLSATQEPSPDSMDAWGAFLGGLGEHLVDAFRRRGIGGALGDRPDPGEPLRTWDRLLDATTDLGEHTRDLLVG